MTYKQFANRVLSIELRGQYTASEREHAREFLLGHDIDGRDQEALYDMMRREMISSTLI
jgi:hypothetical protein